MRSHFKAVLSAYRALSKASASSNEGLAWTCMRTHVTYRLDSQADHQPSIGFRVLWRTLQRIRKAPNPITPTKGDPLYVILEARKSRVEQKVDYVGRQYHHLPGLFLSKEDAPALLKGTGIFWAYIGAALPMAFRCLFIRKERANRALHIAHLAEATALRSFFSTHKPKAIFDFAPYHIDSNWLYLLNRPFTEDYVKLPSPGPLRTHNAITLCDTLVVSSGYHIDELPSLPYIKAKKHVKWLVENAFNYIERYAACTLPEPEPMRIGYYSHGSWIRKAHGHRDDGLNIYEAERQLLQDLGAFLEKHPQFTLTIFAHPREKHPDYVVQSEAFYKDLLGKSVFRFSEPGLRTAHAFEQVDIAVAAFSTIVYERLFCGYKMLVGNYGMAHFPISDSPLNAVCFNTREGLEHQLLRFTNVTRDAYFTQTGLSHYRYDAYPYFNTGSQ
jgi:hypothetical protein